MFRQNVIEIAIDSEFSAAYKFYKPNYSAKFLPEWYKNIPHHFISKNKYNVEFPYSTIKACPAIKKNLTNGIIFPLWTDIVINIDPERRWAYQVADGLTTIQQHDNEQFYGFASNHINLKLVNPWKLKSSENKMFYLTNTFYHTVDTNFKVSPGLIEFYYQNDLNINLFFPIKPNVYTVKLNAGQPIIQLIDTTNKISKIKHSLYSSEEMKKKFLLKPRTTFLNVYKSMMG